jgi:hypothetical protein
MQRYAIFIILVLKNVKERSGEAWRHGGLEFRIWNLFGIWNLEFGIYSSDFSLLTSVF